MQLSILYATFEDIEYLRKHDTHLSLDRVKKKVFDNEVIIAKYGENYLGWLRFGYFWDFIPFINMIVINDAYQKQGVGSRLVQFWEDEMYFKYHHEMVMTSTQADETAQHFYRKLGYRDAGALFEVNDGPAEIFLIRKLGTSGS